VAGAASEPGAARALLLDLDGTLAPFAPTPEEAAVPPETLEAVRRLVGFGWTVAIVSGRPVAQVRAMIPIPGVRAFGSHGLEGSWSGDGADAVDPDLVARLGRIAREGGEISASVAGARVEHKPAGIAFHDRKVPSAELAAWRRRLQTWLNAQDLEGLEILPGNRVLELRPRGIHKGLVARSLLERIEPAGLDESLVAVGDDRTDEDLFLELAGRGLTVRVGGPTLRTAAARRLPTPWAVGLFLQRLFELDPATELR
jgi:trehalose 6-phosphate phosphatase